VLTHGGEATGSRVWRRPAAAAAENSAPASWWLGLSNKRKWELLGILGQAGATCVGGASGRRVELAVRLHWRGGSSAVARLLCARGKGGRVFIAWHVGEGGLRVSNPCKVAVWEMVGGDVRVGVEPMA
jgi:hypothetical protein